MEITPPDVDAIVPGVSEAYARLKKSGGQGIYTSLGRFYNHTIFGRDASMSAKFVTEFDPEVAWQTITTLASYQGVKYDKRTAESPGRIHHEMRSYKAWQSTFYNWIGLNIAGLAWGMRDRQLLTYFAADPTATYVRLINKYAHMVDQKALDRMVVLKDGREVLLRESLKSAVDWLAAQVEDGIFVVHRYNRLSLPYQTFMDSVTAYDLANGRAADSAQKHSFVEVQVYALDALQDALRLFGDDAPDDWREIIATMRLALFREFWREGGGDFAPAIFWQNGRYQQLNTTMISSGFALNTSFWYDLSGNQHRKYLIGAVRRLFASDMLTDVGIRSKSTASDEPLGRSVDYHGSRTVWPMFNFMVIEGLRRHGLYRLAEQLENRLLNAVNAIGKFPEFLIIEHDGTLYHPSRSTLRQRSGQMIPEQNIAFTIVPSLVIARRRLLGEDAKSHGAWQDSLENEILSGINNVELLSPTAAKKTLHSLPIRINQTWSGVRSALHIAPVILSKYEKPPRRPDIRK